MPNISRPFYDPGKRDFLKFNPGIPGISRDFFTNKKSDFILPKARRMDHITFSRNTWSTGKTCSASKSHVYHQFHNVFMLSALKNGGQEVYCSNTITKAYFLKPCLLLLLGVVFFGNYQTIRYGTIFDKNWYQKWVKRDKIWENMPSNHMLFFPGSRHSYPGKREF